MQGIFAELEGSNSRSDGRYWSAGSWKIPLNELAHTALVGLVGATLAWTPLAVSADQIFDGDSLEIEGQRTRLHGIDAFELSQTCLDRRGKPWRCGVAAKAALATQVDGHALRCVVLDEDRDGWYVSSCVAPDGTDLAAYMVRAGLALARPDGSDDYADEQAEARRRRAGAWEGVFMAPWEWRSSWR